MIAWLQQLFRREARNPVQREPSSKAPLPLAITQTPVPSEQRVRIRLETRIMFENGKAITRRVPVNELQEFPDA